MEAKPTPLRQSRPVRARARKQAFPEFSEASKSAEWLVTFRVANMRASPRCGAKTRAGTSCQCPAVKGKRRCYLHGGARGSGAPKGERNGAWKDGTFTNEAVALRREVGRVLKACRQTAKELEDA